MARRLKQELKVPVACLLAGEDSFLDSMPEPHRNACWAAARERARDLDWSIAASRYYAGVMQRRLELDPARVRVVYGGASLEGYTRAAAPPNPPVLGYFARMCPEKGLPMLVDAFSHLKLRNRVPRLRLRVGGGMSPVDEQGVVRAAREKLRANGFLADVDFCPNVNREAKVEFYRSLSVLSVPALYGEAFGLYLAEAWACGVPVVQPRHAAFPELIELSQAGLLCEPGNAAALAETIEQLLLDPGLMRALGQAGRKVAQARFSVESMARDMASVFGGQSADSGESENSARPPVIEGFVPARPASPLDPS
jgi:glycosyltransferase involved in cell wall biosynthesis